MKTILILFIILMTLNNSNAQEIEKTETAIVNQSFGSIAFKETLYTENVTNYTDIPSQLAEKYGSFSYESLPLDRQIAELVRLWVSINNKCSYCTIFHTQDARDSGTDIHKIDNIMAYKQSELFSAKEKAALNYAEAISTVSYEKLQEATKEVKRYFNNEEIETIVMCTVLMDVWARVFAVKGNLPYYKK
ncbi:carboxymuconolactone decarboxylase family protein [Galbibacter orientalis]|uniref:Alkylhydroperoxidase AhpD family core domain n=1 Tax=Galbibacter orientalis DSM 19592 TaxID=926559 RepID=I3CAZ3_9FLAO|nr:carboxymuconolactone decarboxylase family protein [Galbibacter orientalis]EIJ40786.1 alkylhydroperoxidase AhpD family core domain [Galbibacter orientalis DSM 19592]